MHDIWNYSKDILPSFESQSKLSNPKEENAPAEPMQVCLVGFGGLVWFLCQASLPQCAGHVTSTARRGQQQTAGKERLDQDRSELRAREW